MDAPKLSVVEDAEMNETLWKCEQVRAGRVCEKLMFDTKEEAENFLRKIKQSAPDLFWRIEPISLKMVWN